MLTRYLLLTAEKQYIAFINFPLRQCESPSADYLEKLRTK